MTASAVVLGVAVLVGRAPHSTPPEVRVLSQPKYAPVNQQLISHPNILMLDTERGELVPIALGHSLAFNTASCSPWRDEQGRTSIASSWMLRAPGNSSEGSLAFKLARFRWPDGKLMEQTEVNFFPASPPAWSPDASGRILVVGWDGQLYRFDFGQDPRNRDGSSDEFPHRPLNWQSLPQGKVKPMVEDTIWPSDPRLRGLLVSVLLLDGHSQGYCQRQISWLRISPDASSIEAAGNLAPLRSGSPTTGWSDERMPSV
ncbi:hypothetical protein ACYOEI_31235, partial [Singulisphaera rosea]